MPGDIGSTTSTVSIWGAVWAAGTLVCAMVFAIAYWKCRQEFQTSLPVKNDFIKSWLNAHFATGSYATPHSKSPTICFSFSICSALNFFRPSKAANSLSAEPSYTLSITQKDFPGALGNSGCAAVAPVLPPLHVQCVFADRQSPRD